MVSNVTDCEMKAEVPLLEESVHIGEKKLQDSLQEVKSFDNTAITKKTSAFNGSLRRAFSHSEIPNLQCKRLPSLQDSSPALEQNLTQMRHLVYQGEGMSANSNLIEENAMDKSEATLGLKGYSGFLKNAWRKNKLETKLKEQQLAEIKTKADNLAIQVSTLKYILSSDEQVVSAWAREIQTLKTNFAALLKENSALRHEKTNLEASVESLEEEVERQKTLVMNEKNNAALARSEALALETQLNKEREKLARLKREKQSIHEKFELATAESDKKYEEVIELYNEIGDLGHQLQQERAQLKNLEERKLKDAKSLNAAIGEIYKLNDDIEMYLKTDVKMKSHNCQLEKKAAEKETDFKTLCSYNQEQTIRVLELKANIVGNEAVTWKATIFKVASTVIQLPFAVLEAVAFPQSRINISNLPS